MLTCTLPVDADALIPADDPIRKVDPLAMLNLPPPVINPDGPIVMSLVTDIFDAVLSVPCMSAMEVVAKLKMAFFDSVSVFVAAMLKLPEMVSVLPPPLPSKEQLVPMVRA